MRVEDRPREGAARPFKASLDAWSRAVKLAGGVGFGLKQLPRSDKLLGPGGGRGKWIAADCWPDCGSKGYNKAYVEDGVVVRMGTDDNIEDSWNRPQLRACARGQSLRLWLLGADRLKYPMKRKNWEPGGGQKELRGKDEWVRISWDEALDILAGELKRVKETYGNRAILANFVGTITARFLGAYGGFTEQWGGHSLGTWMNAIFFTGYEMQWSDRFDMVETKLFLLWGTNPVWSQAGLPAYTYWEAKKRGARFIAIDPFYNPTYEMLTDEWIPIRPGTDHTMLLGMMHTLVVEDDPSTNPLIDWDFMHRCTVGFDRDHMPEGVDSSENFVDYLLGKDDGQPKDAEWASEICGVPPERIRWLARELAKERDAVLCTSGGVARVDNADSLPQAFITLAAMTGHIGRAHSQLALAHHFGTNGGPQLVQGQNSRSYSNSHLRAPPVLNPLASNTMAGGLVVLPTPGCINIYEINSAVLNEQYTEVDGAKTPIDLRMIYHAHGSRVNQIPNTLEAIKAHRKVEFVVTQNMFMNADAIYSDLVLPVTSRWEREGNVCIGYREQLLWHSKVMEPYFECKDDLWIGVQLAKRLGVDPTIVEPWSWGQEIFNQVADARVMQDDGKTLEPLVTITEEDLAHFGFEGEPQVGRIPIREFQEKGIYHIPREPGDNHSFVYLEAFRNDPERHPTHSQSGKLEIHCQALADVVNNLGWAKIRPIPSYNPPLEGYEATFSDWPARIKGEYPLQIYNVHMPRNAHTFFDNATVMRELFPHEFIMNPADAEARGIANGDTVLVRSPWGKILRTTWVTPLVMPGVCVLGQGARVDLDEETGIDHGGCANVLKGGTLTGGGHSGFNSVIAQVEKWTGAPLRPDLDRGAIIPLPGERM
ncbi:anaerobic dimethyl sulfoxide reductase subunit A [Sphingobium xenophagum]|uniref:Anaerobic dimethyl sulfoxide reductase subunit A n=1 Tax=Sphingobium xenophagum TaxID=121428 RepID=A0ABU1X2E8_SPHXE|nr:molybdopterin-dependent oxidoreductase [Sphingobium xenophagum]MDR7155728.1 anaerobic dimethyl sulfoxide reductase subunit A [Sphingobium xenophagum]